MKRSLFVRTVLLAGCAAGLAKADCLTSYAKTGTRCGSPNSVEILVGNKCDVPAGYSIEKKNAKGGWEFATGGRVEAHKSDAYAGHSCNPVEWRLVERRDDGNGEMKISIYRGHSGQSCTSGYIAVNGTILAYTLELPWKDNRENVSSVPARTYGAILRYDHDDHWRIELRGAPGRDHIQIHTGNKTSDSEGCLLVGLKLTRDLCSIAAPTSKPAYNLMKKAFYGSENPIATPDKRIIVEIVDAGPHDGPLRPGDKLPRR